MKRISAMIMVLASVWPLAAAAECWAPLAAESRLGFQGSQAGAPVRARFERFDARFCLDSSGETGSVSVTVHTDSVVSALPELTQELEGELFFHADKWPTATFESEAIERTDENRYIAGGELRIRDVSRAMKVPFTFTQLQEGNSARANGEITFKRLDFNVGLGEWRNTEWVGNEVTVTFDVALRRHGAD